MSYQLVLSKIFSLRETVWNRASLYFTSQKQWDSRNTYKVAYNLHACMHAALTRVSNCHFGDSELIMEGVTITVLDVQSFPSFYEWYKSSLLLMVCTGPAHYLVYLSMKMERNTDQNFRLSKDNHTLLKLIYYTLPFQILHHLITMLENLHMKPAKFFPLPFDCFHHLCTMTVCLLPGPKLFVARTKESVLKMCMLFCIVLLKDVVFVFFLLPFVCFDLLKPTKQ